MVSRRNMSRGWSFKCLLPGGLSRRAFTSLSPLGVEGCFYTWLNNGLYMYVASPLLNLCIHTKPCNFFYFLRPLDFMVQLTTVGNVFCVYMRECVYMYQTCQLPRILRETEVAPPPPPPPPAHFPVRDEGKDG